MGDPRGFLKFHREIATYRDVRERVKDYLEVAVLRSEATSQEQGSRCMDCGTAFCNWGCPVGNYIPEWNDLLYRGKWERALELLHATNNFPEFTGRLCPALCEYACVLGINDDPVTIRDNELAIIEYGFKKGLITPSVPARRTGKKVAVIGSGPAGLACADELNKAGHEVTVFERDAKAGGILRYGIPDFKLGKEIIDRRLKLLATAGVKFATGIDAGGGYPVKKIQKEFDTVCITIGCRTPRDLAIEGRSLSGIHFAMDYLIQSNKRISGESLGSDELIVAAGKRVVVIGGGDTGADCVGTANRQGALSVTQIELLARPPECRSSAYPWPKYPMVLKVTSSHEEGVRQEWAVLTKRFVGENGKVKKLSCVRVDTSKRDQNGCPMISELPGTEFELETDLVVLAMGFTRPRYEGLLSDLGLSLDARGNVKTDSAYMTSVKGVFSAGDSRRGQSLIVWAIMEGRQAAHSINNYLKI